MSYRVLYLLQGKLPALPGERPTMGDWENHLTTIFPEVRLKKFLEMRGADGGPWRMICALPALWVGLIYEPQAQAEALELISSWTQDDRDYLRAGELCGSVFVCARPRVISYPCTYSAGNQCVLPFMRLCDLSIVGHMLVESTSAKAGSCHVCLL